MAAVILTVAGSDRPGLTAALAEAVQAAGGNWLESRLARLGGRYVGSVLVDIPTGGLAALEAAAHRIDADGLAVTLLAAVEQLPLAGQALHLDLVGQDRPGIVREVTSVLARLGVNIEDFATSVENGAWSGEKLFRATARLLVPAGTATDAVGAALEAISGEIMVDFTVSPPG
ncbi:ACT domain-containing protein [Sphingomonas sp. RT2P30]|uniref:glycine cleavage system protein R n=1 Tax=Parasphingomonas halimpatiens TaxID=3096162 RepID=UPI002FC9BC3E